MVWYVWLGGKWWRIGIWDSCSPALYKGLRAFEVNGFWDLMLFYVWLLGNGWEHKKVEFYRSSHH